MKQRPIQELIDSAIGFGVDTLQINSDNFFVMPTNPMIKDNEFNAGEQVKSLILKPDAGLRHRKPTNEYEACYYIRAMYVELEARKATNTVIQRLDAAEDYGNIDLEQFAIALTTYSKCLQLIRTEYKSNRNVKTVFNDSGNQTLGNIKIASDSKQNVFYSCKDKDNRIADARGESRWMRCKYSLKDDPFLLIKEKYNSEIKEIKKIPKVITMLEDQMIEGLTDKYNRLHAEGVAPTIAQFIYAEDEQNNLLTSRITEQVLINIGLTSDAKKWIKNYRTRHDGTLQFTSASEIKKFCSFKVKLRKDAIDKYNELNDLYKGELPPYERKTNELDSLLNTLTGGL